MADAELVAAAAAVCVLIADTRNPSHRDASVKIIDLTKCDVNGLKWWVNVGDRILTNIQTKTRMDNYEI